MRMSKSYQKTYEAMVEGVVKQGLLSPGAAVTGFWPYLGSAAGTACELLVVGRATNGEWSTPLTRRELGDVAAVPRRLADAARDASEPDIDEPLEAWLEKKNAKVARRSAFWRVTRGVAEHLGIPKPHWASQIAWTNIAKLAPHSGWNPGERLWQAQRESVFDLFKQELAELRPKRVLVLAGWDWFENLSKHVGATLIRARAPLHRAGTIGDATVVVSPHPMRKPERPIIEGAVRVFSEVQTVVR